MKKQNLIVLYSCFLLGSVMSGCATYHEVPISAGQSLSLYNERVLDNPAMKEFISKNLDHEIGQWPPASWDFNTLTLVAFYYHPDLYVVRTKGNVAAAGIITAGQRPNPSILFSPTYDVNPAAGVSPWTLGPSLDIPVETAGKRGLRIAKARHLSQAASLDIATMTWQVRSRLREAFLDFYIAIQKEAILKKQMAMQGKNIHLLEERLSKAEASPIAVNQAKILFDKALLLFNGIKKQEKEAYVRLADSLGLPVSALEGVNFDFSIFKDTILSGNPDLKMLRRYALLNRSDILSALSEYEASQSALQLEIAKQYPDINIGPGYLWDQSENKWSLGLSVTLPVFNQNQGPIAEALANREGSKAKFMAVQSKAVAEIDEGLETYQGALEKFKSAENLLAAQKKQSEFLKSATQEGEIHRVTLLNSQIELNSIQSIYLDNLAEVQKAIETLERILQRPLIGHGKEKLALKERQEGVEKEGERPVEAQTQVFKEEGKDIIDLNEETQELSGIIVAPLGTMTYKKDDSQEARKGVLIPRSAIVWLDGQPFVYIKEGEDHFVREVVSDYILFKNGWFASEKFKPEERIVVSGAQMLLSTEFQGQIKVGEEGEDEDAEEHERGQKEEKSRHNKENDKRKSHEKKDGTEHKERD